MRLILEKAISRLRRSGSYEDVSELLAFNIDKLAKLRRMTLFAPNDLSAPPPAPLSGLRLLVVRDFFVTKADLRRAPWGTELPSLEPRERVQITCRGAGICARGCFFGIREPDLALVDERIAVHGVERTFHCEVPGILSLFPSWGSAEDQDFLRRLRRRLRRRRRHAVDFDAPSRPKIYLVGNNAP